MSYKFLVVSIGLILVSFTIVKFTIGFTITEEFREIGVMKAIGIKDSSIRCLYIVKYLGIAITGVFSICLLLVMILSNTANTLCSDKLMPLFGLTYSDAYYVDTGAVIEMMDNSEGDESVYGVLHEIEDILSENGLPAECPIEIQYKHFVSFDGHAVKLMFQQGKGTHVDRSVEVLQNLMENAIKYGDGREIRISFSAEEDARLVAVTNSGSTLPEPELIHIFDSFWRGSNSNGRNGSGLGLYICRQLMMKMGGDIFAEIKGDEIRVTAVFRLI